MEVFESHQNRGLTGTLPGEDLKKSLSWATLLKEQENSTLYL